MKIDRPIFIVGSGRSGTTLIYNLIACHPLLGWFSNWTNRFPAFPHFAILSRAFRPEWLRARTFGRFTPIPAMEGSRIYKHCGIHDLLYQKQRRLQPGDVPPRATAHFVRIIEQHLSYHHRPRFLHKNTNNSMRISYLTSVFPDALFVHIVRDPRAVVRSLLNVSFWPDLRLWWFDRSPRQWEAEGGNLALLAARHWQRQVGAITSSSRHLSDDNYMLIRYEDFVDNPVGWMRDIIRLASLPWAPDIEQAVAQSRIRNLNKRWEDVVDQASMEAAWEEIRESASCFGYV